MLAYITYILVNVLIIFFGLNRIFKIFFKGIYKERERILPKVFGALGVICVLISMLMGLYFIFVHIYYAINPPGSSAQAIGYILIAVQVVYILLFFIGELFICATSPGEKPNKQIN
jgi:hypothetical protein